MPDAQGVFQDCHPTQWNMVERNCIKKKLDSAKHVTEGTAAASKAGEKTGYQESVIVTVFLHQILCPGRQRLVPENWK